MAINSGATIPTAVYLLRIVNPDCDNIFLIKIEVGCQFITERRVTIRINPKRFTVDKYFGIHVNPFEINGNAFTSPFRRSFKGFAVPAYTCREKTTGIPSWVFRLNLPFDTPIMRQVEFTPVLVIEIVCFGFRSIA